MTKLTDKQIAGILDGIIQPEHTTHLAIHLDEEVVFAQDLRSPLHAVSDLREILELRQRVKELEAQLPQSPEGE